MISYQFTNRRFYAPLLDSLLKSQFEEYSHLDVINSLLVLNFSLPVSEAMVSSLLDSHEQSFQGSFDYQFEVSRNTQEAAIEFSRQLLHDWVRRNTLEGMSLKQSLWVFSRFEDFQVTSDFGGKKVDMFKMFYSGALPTVYYCLLQVTPDDMTQPYHWLTQARIDWVKGQVENFIGPGMAAYIRSLL